MRAPAAVGVAVVVAALLTSVGVLAQPTQAELQASSRTHYGEGVLSPDPVFESPFSAEALTLWRPPASSGLPEWRATARYYRDRLGRVRVEQGFVGHAGQSPHRIIVVPEPAVSSAYILDPTTRTVTRVLRGYALMAVGGAHSVVMPLAATRFIAFHQPPMHAGNDGATHTEESLGHRTFAGVNAVGTRLEASWLYGPTHQAVRTTQERWMATDLQVMVYSRTDDSIVGVVEHQLTGISRSDPDAALFTVPAGYAEAALPFPQKWENPYVLTQTAR